MYHHELINASTTAVTAIDFISNQLEAITSNPVSVIVHG